MIHKVIENPKDYVNFAAFECYANCILTLLKIWDLPERYFFMQYWFLWYEDILLSAKNPRMNYLEDIYGIDYRFYPSTNHNIVDFLKENGVVLLYCDTCSLRYYPKEYSEGSEFDLMHFIIIYGYNDEEESFYIIDPTVDFIGSLSYGDIDKVIEEVDNKIFIGCKKPEIKKNLSLKKCFKNATRQNYLLYHLGEKSSGLKATEGLSKDLMICHDWDSEKRENWLYYNCVTLTTIIKNRNAIIKNLLDTELFEKQEIEFYTQQHKVIMKDWNGVNLLLTKLRMKKDFSLVSKITQRLDSVTKNESLFLNMLYEKGRMF